MIPEHVKGAFDLPPYSPFPAKQEGGWGLLLPRKELGNKLSHFRPRLESV